MYKIITFITLLIYTLPSFANEEVNLYSARQEALIKPLLDAFTANTGIQVNIISSSADALLKRIQSEGINSPADVLLTTDAGRLWRAKQAQIFAPVDSDILQQVIPPQYRDPELHWFGLSVRARPIMIFADADISIPTSYEDLSNADYQNKICIRSSNNIYNQSLIASMIATLGETATERWVEGLVANFARSPQGGDRDQIRAAAAGQCDVAVANTYYLGQMLADENNSNDQQAGKKITVIWPNQSDRGVHVNVSGAGLVKTAPNKDNAIKLLEFLASDTAQQIYADVNFEYPAKQDIEINSVLSNWGEFKADNIQLDLLGEHNAAAVRLMDRAGWK
ncbi:MAG: Fe(3+) ABC transporter substrate-binding protein [Acidiferrobacterales bacterium]|nr:Fe(3+) ABC transporter substrate-binding protein [Acidiferrobacterales bacterium]